LEAQELSHENWQAKLVLGFNRVNDRTVINHRQRSGPLTIQRPFYPEGDVCHAYILHPPGGVVGGDYLQLDVSVNPEAAALLTTPGATKFYRSQKDCATQYQHFKVRDGLLEWLPQENIFFPEAHARLHTRIDLEGEHALYCGWEIDCLGRPAINEDFSPGNLTFKTDIYRHGKPLYIDRLQVSSLFDLTNTSGLKSYPVNATMLVTSADAKALGIIQALTNTDLHYGYAGATLFNDVLIIRYLGSNTAEAHQLFRHIWKKVRPLIQARPPVPPRIWDT
jgi:urease accessory protein